MLFLLGTLLVTAAGATVTRRMETTRQAVRAELRGHLRTTLESALVEAWWKVGRAVPAGRSGGTGPGASLRSTVLKALEDHAASPSGTTDPIPPVHTRAGLPKKPVTLELEDVAFGVESLEPGGDSGLVSLKATGRARRGRIEQKLAMKHLRRFEVTRVTVSGVGGDRTFSTVRLVAALDGAEVCDP